MFSWFLFQSCRLLFDCSCCFWRSHGSYFRGLVLCAVGVLQAGAEVEAVDPAGTGLHSDFWPVHGLLVLLVAPALHPSSDQTDSGGSAPGDWTPPTLMSSILQCLLWQSTVKLISVPGWLDRNVKRTRCIVRTWIFFGKLYMTNPIWRSTETFRRIFMNYWLNKLMCNKQQTFFFVADFCVPTKNL